MRMQNRIGLTLLAAALLLGCGDSGYDAPEQAEPFDSIAPAPEQELVPGASEPGPQSDAAPGY